MRTATSAHAPMPPNESELLAALADEIGQDSVNTWFVAKTSLTADAEELTIAVLNPYLQSWIDRKFRAALSRIAHKLLGPAARVRLCVRAIDRQDAPPAAARPPIVAAPAQDRAVPLKIASAARTTTPHGIAGVLPFKQAAVKPVPADQATTRVVSEQRRYADLADFVQGACNDLVVQAARDVSAAPGAKYSPLFIHGASGLGKTHLLEGIYRAVRKQFPAMRVALLTAESFGNYFTRAIREHSMPNFRQRFRNVDVLLVDEIDFFDGKEKMQEEFLHTLQNLEARRGQAVVTSDRHPRLLSKTCDELVTRFQSGFVGRLDRLDLQTRKQIVARCAAKRGLDLSPAVMEFVAERFQSNARELEGAVNCLETLRAVRGKPVTLSSARQLLSEMQRDCIRTVHLSDVSEAVCNLFGTSESELKSSCRRRTVSEPRMLAMFLARKLTNAAYSEIGEYFGGRNHSTVMAATKKVGNALRADEHIQVANRNWPLKEILESLEQQLAAC